MTSTDTLPQLVAVTREEAARITGLSTDTIRRAINTGDLKAKRHGRRIVVPMTALRDWIDSLDDF